MKHFIAALLAGMFLVSHSATSGEKKDDPFAGLPKPGPEHKFLASMEGAWTANVKSWFGPGEPKESTGTMDRKMIMGRRYLQESFKGEFLGTKFEGMGIVAYDVNKKKYVTTWIDNMTTGISMMQGTYDTDSKTLTSLGEEDNPAMGGKMKTRDVLKITSADEQRFEMFRTPLKTGKEFKVMEITYTRKKS